MTVEEAITNTVGFRVRSATIQVICAKRGLRPNDTFDANTSVRSFDLATADAVKLALTMPNVSEGGVSISMPDKDKLLAFANSIYSQYGEPIVTSQAATVKPIDL